jgi:dipeptide/tripeptide permease
LELFERLAFYSSKAILTVYLVETLGLGSFGNSLAGFYTFAIFFLPILAGTFVDRFGFRKSLLSCFAIFSLGYALIALAALPWASSVVELLGVKLYVSVALAITAIGGSLIKPSIVGTVARTTDESNKSLGYSIYYTLVNIGGAVGPLLALAMRSNAGIQYVMLSSALTSVLLFLGTFVFFKEPQAHADAGPTRAMSRVLQDMLLVFRNLRFVSFLVIFSGFWIMFWQTFYSVPFYVKDILGVEEFELLESVGPWTIIFLTVPVTAAMKKLRPISAMSIAFAVASSAWLLNLAWPSTAALVLCAALFSIGETMQAPRFYEYVAELAPKDQVGTFMGFAFLPVAVGALLAGPLSGFFVERFIKTGNPAGMWIILSAIGAVSTLAMLAYNRFLLAKPDEGLKKS